MSKIRKRPKKIVKKKVVKSAPVLVTEHKPTYGETPKFEWSPPVTYYNTNDEIRLMIAHYGKLIIEMPDQRPPLSDSEFVHNISRWCGRMVELAKQLKQDKPPV